MVTLMVEPAASSTSGSCPPIPSARLTSISPIPGHEVVRLGSTTNPYSSVNAAVGDAGSDFLSSGDVQQVRVVGGTYTIGLDNIGIPIGWLDP